jgi:ATP-dependent protease Clp ATPase subunit
MRIRTLRCSFCRKTEDHIAKLVAGPRLLVGPRLYICNECVAVANSIMQGNPPPIPTASRSLRERLKERWHQLLQRRMSHEASVT